MKGIRSQNEQEETTKKGVYPEKLQAGCKWIERAVTTVRTEGSVGLSTPFYQADGTLKTMNSLPTTWEKPVG